MYATHNGKRIPYLLGVLIGLDQFANAVIPKGDIDATISARLGVAMKEGRLTWKKKPFARLIYSWLERVQKNHSIKSIED